MQMNQTNRAASLGKPNLVLRVGVVGRRVLTTDKSKPIADHIPGRLFEVYSVLMSHLDSIGQLENTGDITDYYSNATPILRVVTGLDDGADQLAARTLLGFSGHSVTRELAAILPFDIGTYRNSSPISDTTSFDQLLASCHYVMELDGRYVSGGIGKRQRSRAYRQQGEVLLRQCDLLIALDEIGHEGSAGGTAETINRAFAIGMKVLFLPTNANMIRLVGNANELENVYGQNHDTGSIHNGWRDALKVCVEDILCNPSRTYPGGSQAAEESKEAGTELLAEYFGLIENKP